jgi:hypothetical protein
MKESDSKKYAKRSSGNHTDIGCIISGSLAILKPSNESSPFAQKGERGWGRVGETN